MADILSGTAQICNGDGKSILQRAIEFGLSENPEFRISPVANTSCLSATRPVERLIHLQ